MHVLRDADSIETAIKTWPDRHIGDLLTSRVEVLSQYEDLELSELINVILVEPGDTLQAIDAEMGFTFLVNHYSGKRFGEPAFVPCFETLEEYATFYDMAFVQGDEGFGIEVLVPKRPDIDPDVLALCAKHATRAREWLP